MSAFDDTKQTIEKAEQILYKTYNRFPVIFDHGKGVFLYDTEGKEYLDFGAGIAVCAGESGGEASAYFQSVL